MESKLPEEKSTQLPADVVEQIEKDADEYARTYSGTKLIKRPYIAGATEWAQWFVKQNAVQSELHGVRAENERLKDQNGRLHEKNKLVSEEYRKLSVERNALKERAERMEKALIKLRVNADSQSLMIIIDALAWKEGKDAVPVKEIEYMPILSAELRELKDIPNVPTRVPMHLLSEQQAYSNHGQTLRRLKERGGLSVREAISIINCKPWRAYGDLPNKEAVAMLNNLITNPTK
jgi:hypothetical protein